MKKKIKVVILSFLSIVLVGGIAFLIYASFYYKADQTAVKLLNNDNIVVDGNLTLIEAEDPSDTAIIFYPGAKVENIAYLPILNKITQDCDITTILVKMPLNMAIFDSNAADKVIEKFPEIDNWYISGHSMGGAMASSYASNNKDKITGLILMGAYIYGDYSDEDSLTIYGSYNTSVKDNIDYDDNIVVIDGGNHAQFGNYGKQKGDADASITWQEQQRQAVDAIQDFLISK